MSKNETSEQNTYESDIDSDDDSNFGPNGKSFNQIYPQGFDYSATIKNYFERLPYARDTAELLDIVAFARRLPVESQHELLKMITPAIEAKYEAYKKFKQIFTVPVDDSMNSNVANSESSSSMPSTDQHDDVEAVGNASGHNLQ